MWGTAQSEAARCRRTDWKAIYGLKFGCDRHHVVRKQSRYAASAVHGRDFL